MPWDEADFERFESRVKDLERRMHTLEDDHDNLKVRLAPESDVVEDEPAEAPKARRKG